MPQSKKSFKIDAEIWQFRDISTKNAFILLVDITLYYSHVARLLFPFCATLPHAFSPNPTQKGKSSSSCV